MSFLPESLKEFLAPTPSHGTQLSYEVMSPEEWRAQHPGFGLTRDGITEFGYGMSPQSLMSDQGKDSHQSAFNAKKKSGKVLNILTQTSIIPFTASTKAPSVYPGSKIYNHIVMPASCISGSQNQVDRGDGLQIIGFSIQTETDSHPTNVLVIHPGNKSRNGHKSILIAGLSDKEHVNLWDDILSRKGSTPSSANNIPTFGSVEDRRSEQHEAFNFPDLRQSVERGIEALVKSPYRSPKPLFAETMQKMLKDGSTSLGTFLGEAAPPSDSSTRTYGTTLK